MNAFTIKPPGLLVAGPGLGLLAGSGSTAAADGGAEIVSAGREVPDVPHQLREPRGRGRAGGAVPRRVRHPLPAGVVPTR
jgi:hypothetical protein